MCLRPFIPALFVCTVGLTMASPLACAGPLNPPPGAVAPTGKTLVEVEPRIAVNDANTPGDDDALYKITQPGSYYLTGNVVGVANKHGIEIAASGVALDLNGFEVNGAGSPGFFSGVMVSGLNLRDIAVVNGSVRNWLGEAGLDLFGIFGATNCRADGVLASGNTGIGIRIGNGSTAVNCSASGNVGIGISGLSGCVISNCSAWQNGASGISVGTAGLVTDCTSRQNTVDGVRCAFECVIRGNVCSANGNGGSGAGVHATGGDNRIEGNNCTNADRGVDVDVAGNFIIGNTCSGNTTNWDIAANNFYGPIINRAGQATAGYTGDGIGTGTIGTTDPHANWTY